MKIYRIRIWGWAVASVLVGGLVCPSTGDEGPRFRHRTDTPISDVPHEYVAKTVTVRGNQICNFIDFEGILDNTAVGSIPGNPDVTFHRDWTALVDCDPCTFGCGLFCPAGNFANEPSPNTATTFLERQACCIGGLFCVDNLFPEECTGNLGLPAGAGTTCATASCPPPIPPPPGPPPAISFSQGVQYIEVHYSASAASLPVTMTAWGGINGTGQVITTSVGTTIGVSGDGAACTGDPNGAFCLWDALTVESATNNIRSITFRGAVQNQFGFDNMTFCVALPGTGACCLTGAACEVTTEENCGSRSGTYRGDDSTCAACQGCDPPRLVEHPTSQVICAGGGFTFNIAAEGTQPLTYQWRLSGVGIPGATSSTYDIDPATDVHSGTYDVEVRNGCGSVISDAAVAIAWPTATGDVNGDGLVSGLDIAAFIAVFLAAPAGPANLDFCAADMNHDGRLNQLDVTLFVAVISRSV